MDRSASAGPVENVRDGTITARMSNTSRSRSLFNQRDNRNSEEMLLDSVLRDTSIIVCNISDTLKPKKTLNCMKWNGIFGQTPSLLKRARKSLCS